MRCCASDDLGLIPPHADQVSDPTQRVPTIIGRDALLRVRRFGFKAAARRPS